MTIAHQQNELVATNSHIFTLIFPGRQMAVLDVRGANDQEEARAIACEAIPNGNYEVVDGDQAGGGAMIFYLWCSLAALQCQPRRQYKVVQDGEEAAKKPGHYSGDMDLLTQAKEFVNDAFARVQEQAAQTQKRGTRTL